MKIFLDTNIYDYVAKQGNDDKLRDFFRKKYYDVEVSLDVIFEVARIPDEKIKEKCFQTIWKLGNTYPKFPESYLETHEVINEFKRCRPDWLYSTPHEKKEIMAFVNNYRLTMKSFRRNGFLKTNESFDEYVSLAERAVSMGNPNDKEIRQALLKYENLEIRSDDPEIQELLNPLSDSERFWRSTSSSVWRHALKGDPSMRDYKDYLLPYLQITTVDKMEWESFWLRDVVSKNIPRTYIRGVTEYFQLRFKITHGNKIDSNHSLNLVGNHLFLTGDKNFFQVLQQVSENSATKIAKPLFIDRNNNDAYDEITKVINAA
jgi:hypothetical protein